jgi:hypothetical protein
MYLLSNGNRTLLYHISLLLDLVYFNFHTRFQEQIVHGSQGLPVYKFQLNLHDLIF